MWLFMRHARPASVSLPTDASGLSQRTLYTRQNRPIQNPARPSATIILLYYYCIIRVPLVYDILLILSKSYGKSKIRLYFVPHHRAINSHHRTMHAWHSVGYGVPYILFHVGLSSII